MTDIRGMYVTQPSASKGQTPPARLTSATPNGIFKSSLTPVVADAPTAES